MDSKMRTLRSELDELGYYQTLVPEAVPLVERLLNDLKTTTESLQKYMKIAKKALEERDNLQLGAQPYKCDNARLVKECNELHLSFLQFREQNDQIQRELKTRIEILNDEHSKCTAEKDKLKQKIIQLEKEILDRADIFLTCQKGRGSNSNSSRLKTTSNAALLKGQPRKTITTEKDKGKLEISSAMALADQKISQLAREVKKLKEQNLVLLDEKQNCQSQLENRNMEINRLTGMLEGGRPLGALKKDCCSCNTSVNNERKDDVSKLLHEKNSLEKHLKETLAKQHEAMKRALHLAERNKLLEKELQDIDHLALAVETECNNTVKNSNEKVNRLQERLHISVVQIQNLERENARLRQEKVELSADLDAVILEKKRFQDMLETTRDENKALSDKINNFTVIEHDLNMEIDRLNQISAAQKRKMAELECDLISGKSEEVRSAVKSGDKFSIDSRSQGTQKDLEEVPRKESYKDATSKKKTVCKKSTKNSQSSKHSISSNSGFKPPENTPQASSDRLKGDGEKCCCDCCSSAKHLQELLDKQLNNKDQQASRCIEHLTSEKDYYMREYNKVLEHIKNGMGRTDDKSAELARKLAENEQLLATFQNENRMLSQEKYNLMARLDTARDRIDTDRDSACFKTSCKRTERERELFRADVERLQEERDALKQRIKSQQDFALNEKDKLQKCLCDSEEQIRRLESERRELQVNRGSSRATITSLEDHRDSLKEQLRTCQMDLTEMRARYKQLSTLHEEMDKTLTVTQEDLIHTTKQLESALETIRQMSAEKHGSNKEAEMLQKDIDIMKSQLIQLEKDKDELLNDLDFKTEKLVALEREMKGKDKTIAALEEMVKDLKAKISLTSDESSTKELQLRTSKMELDSLQQELESARRIKDSALKENRRLQDDLVTACCDCKDARKELEICRRQVDDLKTQLQHYVAEVKRTEDLISNKEVERNELLDQFRSLSHEAVALETTNHTLETENSQSKVQLSLALQHAEDLERKLQNQDSIIRSYEKQIADLTSQMASLEMQVKQALDRYDRTEQELQNMRELCLKLDTENDRIKRQLRERDDQKVHTERNVEKLRTDHETLQHTMAKDKRSIESMERILTESQQEATDLRMLNEDLREEVERLKSKVQELQDRLYKCICADDSPTKEPTSNRAKKIVIEHIPSLNTVQTAESGNSSEATAIALKVIQAPSSKKGDVKRPESKRNMLVESHDEGDDPKKFKTSISAYLRRNESLGSARFRPTELEAASRRAFGRNNCPCLDAVGKNVEAAALMKADENNGRITLINSTWNYTFPHPSDGAREANKRGTDSF